MAALADPIQHFPPNPPSGELIPNANFAESARTANELAAYWAISQNPDNAGVEIVAMDNENVLRFVLHRCTLDKATESGPALSPETIITSTGELRPPQPGDQFTVSFEARLDTAVGTSDISIAAYVEMQVAYADGTSSRLVAHNAITGADWTAFSTVLQVDPTAREIQALYINVGCYWANYSTTQTTGVPEVSLYMRNTSARRYMPGPKAIPVYAVTDGSPIGTIETAAGQVEQAGATAVVAVLPGLEAIIAAKLKEMVPQLATDLEAKLRGLTIARLESGIAKSPSWLVTGLVVCLIAMCMLAAGFSYFGNQVKSNLAAQKTDIETSVQNRLAEHDKVIQAQLKEVTDQRTADQKQREADSKSLHDFIRYGYAQSVQINRTLTQELQTNKQLLNKQTLLQNRVRALEQPPAK